MCQTKLRKRAFSPSLSTKEAQMPRVFPDITKTLLSTEEQAQKPKEDPPS